MKLISFNVNGIRAIAKKGLLEKIAAFDADIIAFQETKSTVAQANEVLFGSGYEVYGNQAERAGYSGTAILSRVPVLSSQLGIGIAEHDDEGRVVTIELADFFVVNVYVPNSGNGLVRLPYREHWDKAFTQYLNDLQKKKPVIVCGDLNVAHQRIDIARPDANYNKTAGYTQHEIDGLSHLLATGFVDSFRELHPEKVAYSWWSYRGGAREKNIGWRLDYFLVDKRLRKNILDATILQDVHGSDHCPVGLMLSL